MAVGAYPENLLLGNERERKGQAKGNQISGAYKAMIKATTIGDTLNAGNAISYCDLS